MEFKLKNTQTRVWHASSGLPSRRVRGVFGTHRNRQLGHPKLASPSPKPPRPHPDPTSPYPSLAPRYPGLPPPHPKPRPPHPAHNPPLPAPNQQIRTLCRHISPVSRHIPTLFHHIPNCKLFLLNRMHLFTQQRPVPPTRPTPLSKSIILPISQNRTGCSKPPPAALDALPGDL